MSEKSYKIDSVIYEMENKHYATADAPSYELADFIYHKKL